MCDNKDKQCFVYAFLILFAIATLFLCASVREARDDLQKNYVGQGTSDALSFQLTDVAE